MAVKPTRVIPGAEGIMRHSLIIGRHHYCVKIQVTRQIPMGLTLKKGEKGKIWAVLFPSFMFLGKLPTFLSIHFLISLIGHGDICFINLLEDFMR